MSVSDTRVGRRTTEDSKPGKKTNVSQAARTTLKGMIYVREPRTEASNVSRTAVRRGKAAAILDVDSGFAEATN